MEQGKDNAMSATSSDMQSAPAGRKMTYGERLVGLTFNPSNDDKVAKAKRLCADLADLLHDETFGSNNEITALGRMLYDHTVGEILNAQMNVVKVLTLKY